MIETLNGFSLCLCVMSGNYVKKSAKPYAIRVLHKGTRRIGFLCSYLFKSLSVQSSKQESPLQDDA